MDESTKRDASALPATAEQADAPAAEPVAVGPVLICQCGASARFMPLYRFTAARPQLQLQHAPTVRCGNCNQWYQWQTDGWARVSQLDDLEQVLG